MQGPACMKWRCSRTFVPSMNPQRMDTRAIAAHSPAENEKGQFPLNATLASISLAAYAP